ncbi:MAG TPA: endonuclease/exonuclease/phosphatase family protein, partial [Phycisphaerales bacterium]|nr:endonuclease/exonuclease/phosphatase family protein [Phycisphaerales bacterium]
SRIARWLRPTQAARRGLIILVWLACITAFAALIFIHVEDAPLDTTSRTQLRLAFLAFMARTFTLHAAIGSLAFAALAFLVRQRFVAIALALIALGFAFPAISLLVSRKPDALTPGAREVRILSMNVLLNNPDAQPALAFIREQRPDIILVQEHTPAWHKALTDALATDYPFIINEMRGDAFGQAIFSKHPFAEPPVLHLSKETQAASARITGVQSLYDPQIRAVIDIAGSPLVIQNVHTVPPAGMSLFYEQRIQFLEFIQLAQSETRPLVMSGDFNATANSGHIARLLAAGMRDANAVAGAGLGHTWPDIGPLQYLPGIRIDQTLVNSRVRVHKHLVGPSIGSDHLPLLTCISMQ